MIRLSASYGAYRLSSYKHGMASRQRKSCRRFAGEHVSDQRTAHRARRSRSILDAPTHQRRIGPEE